MIASTGLPKVKLLKDMIGGILGLKEESRREFICFLKEYAKRRLRFAVAFNLTLLRRSGADKNSTNQTVHRILFEESNWPFVALPLWQPLREASSP